MMRLLRRASLLVAFSLLTSAATATAECAWVVWRQGLTRSTGAESWFPQEAFDSVGDCRVAEKVFNDVAERERDAALNLPPLQRQPVTFTYLCLPVPIDPRGPKGR